MTGFLPFDQLRKTENFGDVTPMASSSRHAPLKKKIFLADQIYAARSLSAVDSALVATFSCVFFSFSEDLALFFMRGNLQRVSGAVQVAARSNEPCTITRRRGEHAEYLG
jgi:hypothetical protein